MSMKDKNPKQDQESHKPGGKVIRGGGRGGISRASSSGASYIPPSSIRESFMKSTALQMTKLTVSNLHETITDADVDEIFSRFGPLLFAKVQRDETGRSLGHADVMFEKREEAIEAIKYCNGELLEGQQMNIEFSHRLNIPASTASSSSSSNPTGSQEKSKRKYHRRPRRTRRTNDDVVDTELAERTEKLNISGSN